MVRNEALAGEPDEFIQSNLKLVHHVTKGFIPRLRYYASLDYDDIVQIGSIGLIKAYNKFDSAFGTRFSTYAVPMILGEVRKFLRDYGQMKFSRNYKELYRLILNDGNLQESVQWLATQYGVDTDVVWGALEYGRNISLKSMDEVIHENDGGDDVITLREQVGILVDMDTNMQVKEFLDTLDDKQREVFRLYYIYDVKQNDIGNMIGVSQVQVSRMLYSLKLLALDFFGEVDISDTMEGNVELAKKLLTETDMSLVNITKETGCNYQAVSLLGRKLRKPKPKKKRKYTKKPKEVLPMPKQENMGAIIRPKVELTMDAKNITIDEFREKMMELAESLEKLGTERVSFTIFTE